MAELWTKDRVLSLAPDAASAKAGQGQASLSKWPTLGRCELIVWGEAQGSGQKPYQVCVDLGAPAFKCSCPSRKFPCKHALGLLLIFAEQPARIPAAETAEWVREWLVGREKRAEQRAKKAVEQAAKPVDLAAQAKRAAQREANVQRGAEELARFLRDAVRQGLAAVRGQSVRRWDEAAARLIDAQAPGLARLVRELGEAMDSGSQWQSRALRRLGRLHLAVEAARRLAELSPELQFDVRMIAGWTQSQDELLKLPAESGRWCVAFRQIEQEDRLTVQRTWLLRYDDGRAALVLSFAANGQSLDVSLLPGTAIDAELVFYPSGAPLRATVKSKANEPSEVSELPGASSIGSALEPYRAALAKNPWVDRWPVALKGVVPVLHRRNVESQGTWRLQDEGGRELPLAMRFDAGWAILALSGGRPIDVFGEWNGEELAPLSFAAEGTYYAWKKYGDHSVLTRGA